jgi:hypothetical protein
MPTDSLILIAAVLLFAASLFAAKAGAGVYLRFAAMLCAALALAAMAQWRVPGLAEAAALVTLPLAGVSLGLGAIAQLTRPLPALPATMALAAALAGGLIALFGGGVAFALLPLLLGGLAAFVAALHRAAAVPLLAGLLLMASAAAFAGAGVAMPGLLLLAASLAGFALQRRRSKMRAALASAAS